MNDIMSFDKNVVHYLFVKLYLIICLNSWIKYLHISSWAERRERLCVCGYEFVIRKLEMFL
jgi:hypothetical protein